VSFNLVQENEFMSLAVFANFRIDTEERLQRMKDSFESFNGSEIEQWVINARGPFKDDAVQYLKDRLGVKLISFNLESKDGWFFDSRKMIEIIKCDYVFFWIEDHICMCGANQFNVVVRELKSLDVEYLGYSWFGMGLFLNQFRNIAGTEGDSLTLYNYTKEMNLLRQKNSLLEIGVQSYFISLCGIFKKDLFVKILKSNRPYLHRWPKQTPFDFEKRWDDIYILPVRYGVPKFEMFAAIDDDNVHPGSSLFARGLYPNRVSRADMLAIRDNIVQKNNLFGLREILGKFSVVKSLSKFLKRVSYHF